MIVDAASLKALEPDSGFLQELLLVAAFGPHNLLAAAFVVDRSGCLCDEFGSGEYLVMAFHR